MQVSDEIKDFLRQQSFAVLCLELDLGAGPEAVLVVKATRDLLADLRQRQAPVRVGWAVEATGAGPAACLVVRAALAGAGELAGEAYFDPADEGDVALLGRLAAQERLRVAFLDEDLEPVWLAAVAWDEVRRLEAEQVRDRAEELLERADSYDFEGAKRAFQERLPLDRLLARVFGETEG